jgi:hypothetical protein
MRQGIFKINFKNKLTVSSEIGCKSQKKSTFEFNEKMFEHLVIYRFGAACAESKVFFWG